MSLVFAGGMFGATVIAQDQPLLEQRLYLEEKEISDALELIRKTAKDRNELMKMKEFFLRENEVLIA